VSHEEKISEIEERIRKLEVEVFGKRIAQTPTPVEGPELALEDLKIPTDVLSVLQTRIRKIGYWSLVLILLYFAPHFLTYSNMMSISKQLKKPVSYKWLDTEFHRKKYSGLVRSEFILGLKQKAYTLNEPGRRKAETILAELKQKSLASRAIEPLSRDCVSKHGHVHSASQV